MSKLAGLKDIMQLAGSYWQTCALHAAVELDLFSALSERGLEARELAQVLSCEPRALEMLLSALCALGLVEKNGGKYALTGLSAKHLVKSSPDYMGFIVKHMQHLVPSWSKLSESVRKGGPVKQDGPWPENEREDFLLGMFNVAMGIAPGLAKSLDLSDRECLLDLGGGPGTYAIQFCLANPELEAAIFDLPTSEPFARKTVERFGVAERVDFIPGDYHADSLPDGFDVAWLSQVLHAESPEGCRNILKKAAEALVPGGILYVHEFLLNDAKDGPLFPALFSLNMLLLTPGGQAYSEAEVKRMLLEAGLEDVGRAKFQGPNDSGIIYGHKP